jgi:uncharacterized repeat protein (TIGR01451 family)
MKMKTRILTMKRAASKAFVCGITLLALLAFVLPQAAQASTAANTVIRNTATVNYKDTAGNAMPAVSDSVDVTVSFVCAPAAISAPADQNTDPNTDAVYNYTLTSQANGPDTYTIATAAPTESAGITGSTATLSTTSIVLGATTAAATAESGATSITVPNDAASDSSINGIEAGDTVVIGGSVYTVASVTDNGGTVGGTSTITLSTALTTAVAVSDPIYEQKPFTMTVDPGTVSAASDQTITVTTSATGTGGCDAATDETKTTVHVATLTVSKDVTTDDTCSSGWTSGGSGVSFPPGDTICYRITVRNTGNSNATAVTVIDAMPAYTTYVAGSTLLNAVLVNDVSGVSQVVSGLLVDDVAGRASGSVGTGVLPPYTTGPAGEAIVIFKVQID